MTEYVFDPKSPEDIDYYYQFSEMTLMVIDTDEVTRSEILAFIDGVKAHGYTMFDKMVIRNDFQCDELDEYAADYSERFADCFDAESSSETFTSPEWMFAISDKKDEIEIGDYENTWETCTPYFDRSFGNYLPDYQEYTNVYTAYLDLTQDGLVLTVEEFKTTVMEPMKKFMAEKDKAAGTSPTA